MVHVHKIGADLFVPVLYLGFVDGESISPFALAIIEMMRHPGFAVIRHQRVLELRRLPGKGISGLRVKN